MSAREISAALSWPSAGVMKSFRPGALELLAALELRDGNRAEARLLYGQIADDITAPQGLRARAAQMLSALKE